LSLSRKPTRCKHCRAKFTADERATGRVLHESCVDGWVKDNLPKLEKKRVQVAKKRAAEGRALLRARKAAMKTIPDLIREAQKEFNAYVRLRDSGQTCICCGNPLGDGEIGGAYDCGHYRSTGSALHLRFDERNAHAQRKYCNRYRSGRVVDYRIGLIARIGIEAVEALEADNRTHKWTREELIAIKEQFRAKRRELEAKE